MDVLNKKIEAFLDVSSGYDSSSDNGDGYGSGSGTDYSFGGYGFGYSSGCSSDSGFGDGSGFGGGSRYDSGSGYGNDSGIKEYEGYLVYNIDEVPTIITSLHRNLAKGFTSKHNRFTVPCFVARVGNYFAHGSTAKEALRDAQAKYEQSKLIEERIEDFISKYPSLDTIALNSELYAWHNILTGSCTFGRQRFAEQHGIDINNGSMSVKEFIMLTQNSYRGEIIKQLYAVYGTS